MTFCQQFFLYLWIQIQNTGLRFFASTFSLCRFKQELCVEFIINYHYFFFLSEPSGEQAQGLLFSQALPATFPAGNPSFPPSNFNPPSGEQAMNLNTSLHAFDLHGNEVVIYNTTTEDDTVDEDDDILPSPGTTRPVNM